MSNFWWEGTKISPSLFLIFGRQTVPRRMHGGCHCCHSETVSFVVSLLSRNVPCKYSISEGLAIVPLTHHRFLTKRGQFNGCLHENVLATENPEKRRAYSSAFSSKMWYSRVICVFLRWSLTYIWHVLWGKLSFNNTMPCTQLLNIPYELIKIRLHLSRITTILPWQMYTFIGFWKMDKIDNGECATHTQFMIDN